MKARRCGRLGRGAFSRGSGEVVGDGGEVGWVEGDSGEVSAELRWERDERARSRKSCGVCGGDGDGDDVVVVLEGEGMVGATMTR